MLGQRADAGNGEQRLQLLEVAIAIHVDEVDDVVHQRSPDTASTVIGGDSVGRQLLEMRAHVIARRRHQPRVETIIDGFGDRLHGSMARLDRSHNLALARAPMLDVRTDQRSRADAVDGLDHRTVRRKQPARLELEDALERLRDTARGLPPRLASIITLPPAMTRSPANRARGGSCQNAT